MTKVSSSPELTRSASSAPWVMSATSAAPKRLLVAPSMAPRMRRNAPSSKRFSLRPQRTCERFLSHPKYHTSPPPALTKWSGSTSTPRSPSISLASLVIGPLAPSTTILALIRSAFSRVIWFSSAAGTRMSQYNSTAAQGTHARTPNHRPGLLPGRPELRQLDPRRIVDGALVLDEADQHRAGLLEETRRVVTDVAQPLHHHPPAGEAAAEAKRLHVLGDVDRLAGGDGDAAPGRLGAPADAALGDRLAGHAGGSLELVGRERDVGVDDPGHLPRPGAEVRGRHGGAGAR